MATFGITASAASGGVNEVVLCVDWESKQVSYSKYWSSCPPRTTPLSISQNARPGLSAYEVAVQNGYVGDQQSWLDSLVGTPSVERVTRIINQYPYLSTCYQNLVAAEAAGVLFVVKEQRDSFERRTGCVVEEIITSPAHEQTLAAGLPVITSLRLTGYDDMGRGGLFHDFGGLFYASFEVEIGNADAISAAYPNSHFCLGREGANWSHRLTWVSPGRYSIEEFFGLEFSFTHLSESFWLGVAEFSDYDCNPAEPVPGEYVRVHFDPAQLRGFYGGNVEVDAMIERALVQWGW